MATTLRLVLDKNEVVVTELNNVNGMKGSPKTTNFKSKKKISKVALPDWLIKWQTKCAESPPSRFFFIKIGPPKDKITPKVNFDSPKMKRLKAKVTTGGKIVLF